MNSLLDNMPLTCKLIQLSQYYIHEKVTVASVLSLERARTLLPVPIVH